jgi:hypothetical protein
MLIISALLLIFIGLVNSCLGEKHMLTRLFKTKLPKLFGRERQGRKTKRQRHKDKDTKTQRQRHKDKDTYRLKNSLSTKVDPRTFCYTCYEYSENREISV